MSIVKVFSTSSSWIEGEALRQLQVTSELPGMRGAFGMPDLHPGRGHPVGASFLSEEIVYPYLVGSDIGCGMSLFATGIVARKAKRDRWAKNLNIDGVWDNEAAKNALLAKADLPTNLFPSSVGTIGLGNHFAELLTVDKVFDEQAFEQACMHKDRLYLIVHSGSRGLGDEILRSHTSKHGALGLEASSVEGKAYLAKHDQAVRWAKANREAIADRFGEQINAYPSRILDLCHNSVSELGGCWCHRKGAAPHNEGLVLVPGSRGALTFLVAPQGNSADFGYSLPHGAGRKWARSDAYARMKDRFHFTELQSTKLGGVVICEDKTLLFEEAPEAYKNIATVVADMEAHKMATTVASFKPLLTYKCRNDEL